MIANILVATDGSPHALAATDLAGAIAGKYKARLVLLHVALGSELPQARFTAAQAKFREAERAGRWSGDHPSWPREHRIREFAGHMILDEAAERARAQGAERVETMNDYGATAERTIAHARTLPADLVVMGNRGHGELQTLLVGSASHAVLHGAPCTCITVRHAGSEPGFTGLHRVLAPTDGSDHALKAVTFASDMAAKFGATLSLLHVPLRGVFLDKLRAAVDLNALSESTRAALHAGERMPYPFAPALSGDALHEIGEQILNDARRIASDHGVQTVEADIVEGDPAKAILGAAKDQDCDLIAMGSRGVNQIGRLVIGSVSYKVTHAAQCTCMAVR